MTAWWIRPGVRLIAAIILPLVVPAIITLLIWALPGDPAEIICPPETCGGTAELAARWNLDAGAWNFFRAWMGDAAAGEFGRSWRVEQGLPVRDLLDESIPTTLMLVLAALVPLVLGAVGSATGLIPPRADGGFHTVGLVPAVVFALLGAAYVELEYGAQSFLPGANRLRLVLGALVLGLADGAFAAAVSGVRGLFAAERDQRYVGIALLRGERPLANMLPNVAPALAGQLRARVLHLLSGTVVVEVVLRINGLGDLLWAGTLLQDFGVVLAAATAFALVSAVLLVIQALVEIAVAMWVRRAPTVRDGAAASPVVAA
ncbi:MAG: ABC transporter permease subunit [Deltaproteobacteria bacterium]|nr:ABC transporter permease subunit [Deltaproteobacteria bacterium]